MSLSAPFFETRRLLVRPFAAADLDAFVAYRAHPDVERYQSWSGYTLDQGRELIESMQGVMPGVPGEWYQFALEEHTGSTLVGDLALKVGESEPREAEVGFSLAPAHQGKGYGTEALQALLGYAFGTLKLHRVIAVTDALNTPAAALLERVGMRREAHFLENVFFKGAWGSELLFAMLEREWGAAASRRTGSDAAPASPDAAEDEQRERDDGQDDENGPQHVHGETPSG